MSLELLGFIILSAGLLASGAIVVVARNPIHSAISLVVSFFFLAGLYLTLNAGFVAIIQVLVYAGAIMVLFLFVIMLLNLGHDYQQDLKGWGFSLLALGLSGSIGGLLVQRFFDLEGAGLSLGLAVTGGSELDQSIQELGALGVIAEPLYTTYVVPFEITGILLLVAIVGALVLAKRNVDGSDSGGEDLR